MTRPAKVGGGQGGRPLRRAAAHHHRAHGVVGCLLSVWVAACGLGFGGADNPRHDDPNAIRPTPPDGATSWSSLDWQPVTFEEPPRTSGEQWDQATAVAGGPGGWVAVGSNGNIMGYEGRIWHSADTLGWKLVSTDLLPGLELVGVAATPESFVAIGTNSRNVNGPTTSIIQSTDGRTWAEVETVEGAWAVRVAAGSRGFAVLLEVDDTTDLLLSSDGRQWDRMAGADIGMGVRIADIAWDGSGWLAAGSAGDRAVVLRSADGTTWEEETLPASEPVEGVIDVSAYQVVPGRWATLVLGLDRGPSCAEIDDWCDKYQAAWSWTAETGWARLPKVTWILGRGHGVDVHAAGDAGFLYLLADDARISADGWEWTAVPATPSSAAFPTDAVVMGDRVVAVGIPVGVPLDGEVLKGWFGSAVIRR